MHPGMPLYQMSGEQMADLVAYMEKLGGEIDPGLSGTTIKVGAALPLTGALASIGEDVRNALAASFAEVNDQGGVYGRRIELIVEDSRGDPAGTLEATRRLIEDKGAFALVGSFEPKGSEAANELVQRSEIPLIGPVTLSPRAVIPPNRYVFYLLPTFRDQARALVDFVESLPHSAEPDGQIPPAPSSKGSRLAVIYADGELEADAVSGLRVQAKLNRLEIVAEQRYAAGRFSPAKVIEALAPKRPDFVFFFGAATEFIAFAREMKQAGLTPALLTSVVMLGRDAFNLPPAVAAHTYLSYPAALPKKEEFASFINTMRRSNVELRNPAFQTVAYAAAQAFIEGAKQSTRRLNRPTLISSLEGLKDYQTGVVPPLSFGPNRRVGSAGSYVVGIDLQKRQYVPLGEQLTPKENR
jgi:ABC-type branched-subunit amino acid transport system substrate-binding protein